MAAPIYNLLSLLGETGILSVVLLLLLVFFGHGYRTPTFRPVAPGLMTSLGIFGTFCGIFLALYEFDTSPGEMNESIAAFLGGMRTAFLTSLLGLAASITFRSFESRFPPPPEEHRVVTPEQRGVLDRLDAIKTAIAGEGDSSIVTQMQKLRDENRDGFTKLDGLAETIRDSLVRNLATLIDDIRDIIANQLADSLRNLINNIEEALIKQFGATFVQFNEATQALNKWQADHRAQVEQLTAAFDLAARNITKIAEDCQTIPPTMDQLREVVQTAHANVESLNRQVEAFAGMRQQAEEAFPTIKRNLDEIGEHLSSSARGFETLDATLREAFQSAEQETRRIAQSHAANVERLAAEMDTTVRAAFQSAEQETRRIAQSHMENVERITADMSRTLEAAQRESADKVTGVVEAALAKFTTDTSAEIDRIARAWGGNLVSIAERASEAISKVDGARR